MNELYVYVGPTLQVEKAKGILPNATYLPPIKSGDLFSLSFAKGDVIVIVDGVFELSPTIWHKEIIWAIEKGAIVYGVSSLGAIRAAELKGYGMLGYGQIYKDYLKGKLLDDSEVLVLCDGCSYKPTTIPMVNIRASLKKFSQQIFVEESNLQINQVLQLIKKTNYRYHTREHIIDILENSELELAGEFGAFVKENEMEDQKGNDCAALFRYLASGVKEPDSDPMTKELQTNIYTTYVENKFRERLVEKIISQEKYIFETGLANRFFKQILMLGIYRAVDLSILSQVSNLNAIESLSVDELTAIRYSLALSGETHVLQLQTIFSQSMLDYGNTEQSKETILLVIFGKIYAQLHKLLEQNEVYPSKKYESFLKEKIMVMKGLNNSRDFDDWLQLNQLGREDCGTLIVQFFRLRLIGTSYNPCLLNDKEKCCNIEQRLLDLTSIVYQLTQQIK